MGHGNADFHDTEPGKLPFQSTAGPDTDPVCGIRFA
jgi:hypothetical protein